MTRCWTHLFAVAFLCSSLAFANAKEDDKGGFVLIEHMKDDLKIRFGRAFRFLY